MDQLLFILRTSFDNLIDSLYVLVLPALFFAGLAFAVKGREAFAAARRAAGQVRISLWLHCLDAVFMLPVMALMISTISALVQHAGLNRFQSGIWTSLGDFPTLLLVLFLGDFEGYWRHRFEHTRLIWPSHAIHHSDDEMTWLTLDRFHPINRLTTTALDSTFLVLLGFPAWAVLANTLVRHYYGYFIHADLPWTYGPLGRLFVSPAMHQWHHARDIRYAGTNFATVFSVFDIAFGTYKAGLCDVPLGLDTDMGLGVWGQLVYPLKVWWARWRQHDAGRGAATPVAEGESRPAE
jgi:sterol desaturase/sphingolipid hydroxylase (fatty acid hydroxylase superfamily)